MFVELERARLTRILAELKEKEGAIGEAADILQEIQVETFGQMEREEKTGEFSDTLQRSRFPIVSNCFL